MKETKETTPEEIIEEIKDSILQYSYGNNTIEFAAKEIFDYTTHQRQKEKEGQKELLKSLDKWVTKKAGMTYDENISDKAITEFLKQQSNG